MLRYAWIYPRDLRGLQPLFLSLVLVGPNKHAPTSQGAAAVTQQSTSDQGCTHLGPAPIFPGPLVWHKPVLQRLREGHSIKETPAGGNVTWQTKCRGRGEGYRERFLHWEGLRGMVLRNQKFSRKCKKLEDLSSIVSLLSQSSAAVNTEATWCFVSDYIKNSEFAWKVSENCSCLEALKESREAFHRKYILKMY